MPTKHRPATSALLCPCTVPCAVTAALLCSGLLILHPDVSQINEGKVVEAEGLLYRVLEKAPPHAKLGAYVARGTARALARNLQRACRDGGKSPSQPVNPCTCRVSVKPVDLPLNADCVPPKCPKDCTHLKCIHWLRSGGGRLQQGHRAGAAVR